MVSDYAAEQCVQIFCVLLWLWCFLSAPYSYWAIAGKSFRVLEWGPSGKG